MSAISTRPPIQEVIVVIVAGMIMAASIGVLLYSIFASNANGSTLDDCQKMNGGSGPIWNKGLVSDLQSKCFELNEIDCNHVTYSANYSKTMAIMKFCTGAEKEVD